MVDRQPTRKPVEDPAAPIASSPAAQAPSNQGLPLEASLVDEDTIEGDLDLAAELDTQTASGDDPLDLSEELASIESEAKVRSVQAGQRVVATAVTAHSADPQVSESDSESNAGKRAQWSLKLPWFQKAAGSSVVENVNVANPAENSPQAKTSPQHSKASVPPGGEEAAALQQLPRKRFRERVLMRAVPSWLISMMLHVAILMTLAAIQLEPVREAMGVLLTANSGEDAGTTLDEEFNIRGPEMEAPAAATELDQSVSAPAEFASQELALPDTTSLIRAMDASVDVGTVGNVVESILPSSALNSAAARMSSSLNGRLSGALKSEMLERFGGNAASEKSVSAALKWLSDHQDRSGGWTFGHSRVCRGQCKDDGDLVQATNAATALALLPFLGAGQTHLEGSYKGTVRNGLKFLISRMKVTGGPIPRGSWLEAEAGGNMYSHGLASIVVCEAYAMTRDPDLLQPAQLAVNFIVYAQDPRGGGWRYEPKQPGDTSVVGWQLMALKSGAMGNLEVPLETFRKANTFLDSMALNDGAYYAYDVPSSDLDRFTATTAVGLLCRMYLGWSKDHPGMQEGVKFLSARGPSVENVYYSYYGTQVMRQYGGAEWTKWNTALRDGLIAAQVKDGHAAGSWYSPAEHNAKGGRLYCTAMSAMMLEVYYRHMPLYSEKSSDDDFEL